MNRKLLGYSSIVCHWTTTKYTGSRLISKWLMLIYGQYFDSAINSQSITNLFARVRDIWLSRKIYISVEPDVNKVYKYTQKKSKYLKNVPMGGLIYFGVYGVKLHITKTMRIASILKKKTEYFLLKIKTPFPDYNFEIFLCRLMSF